MKLPPLLVLLLLLLSTCSRVSAEQLRCLQLKGFGFPLDTSELFVSSAGLKAGGRNGWALWTEKNAESMIVMNPENKTYIVIPLGDSVTDGAVFHRPKPESVKKLGTATLCGLQCNGYATSSLEWWACEQTPSGKRANDAWATHLGLPTGYGLPVRIRRLNGDTLVTTTGVTSATATTKPPEFFTLTPNFRLVHDRADLMFSKGDGLKSSDIDDLFMTPPK